MISAKDMRPIGEISFKNPAGSRDFGVRRTILFGATDRCLFYLSKIMYNDLRSKVTVSHWPKGSAIDTFLSHMDFL